MGWNEGYSIMEVQVINLYNEGILTKNVLKGLMEPFRDSDIDRGGSHDLKSKDGKTADEIIISVMEPEKYQEAADGFVATEENGGYNEKLDDLWYEITKREWNFW